MKIVKHMSKYLNKLTNSIRINSDLPILIHSLVKSELIMKAIREGS